MKICITIVYVYVCLFVVLFVLCYAVMVLAYDFQSILKMICHTTPFRLRWQAGRPFNL